MIRHGPSRPPEPYQANEGDNRCRKLRIEEIEAKDSLLAKKTDQHADFRL